MTSTEIKPRVRGVQPAPPETERRKAVLFCPVCGHESPVDGDWLVIGDDPEGTVVCPICATVVDVR